MRGQYSPKECDFNFIGCDQSLYTNIPQEEGINTVCNAYGAFYKKEISTPTQTLKEMLGLYFRIIPSNLSKETTYRLTGPQWVQK